MGLDTNLVVAPEKFRPGMARQIERLQQALARGMPRRGWKIGINVPEVLGRLDLPHPGVGWLDGRRVFSGGAELESQSGKRLHAEPELAIRLARTVPPGCSSPAARDCIGAVHPALEIVDYAKPGAGLDDVVAHCMFHDATVLAQPASLAAARELGPPWPILRVGTRSSNGPRADLVPSDLGKLVAFVADYLAVFGQSLQSDDLLLSGSYTVKAMALGPGDEASADFGPLGTVSVSVAA